MDGLRVQLVSGGQNSLRGRPGRSSGAGAAAMEYGGEGGEGGAGAAHPLRSVEACAPEVAPPPAGLLHVCPSPENDGQGDDGVRSGAAVHRREPDSIVHAADWAGAVAGHSTPGTSTPAAVSESEHADDDSASSSSSSGGGARGQGRGHSADALVRALRDLAGTESVVDLPGRGAGAGPADDGDDVGAMLGADTLLNSSYNSYHGSEVSEDEDELPSYKAVALVKENQPNMQLSIRFGSDGRVIQVAAADIDSVEQLKRRICRVAEGDLDSSVMELSRSTLSAVLDPDKSLAQQGVSDRSVLVLHMAPQAPSHVSLVTTSPAGGTGSRGGGDGGKPEGGGGVGGGAAKADGGSGASDPEPNDSDDDSQPPAYSMLDRAIRASRDFAPMTPVERFFQVLLMTFVLLLLVGFFVALPAALIAVGASNLDRCPARSNIPVWMIVFGSVYLVQSGLDRVISVLRNGIEVEIRRRPDYEVMPASRVRVMVEHEYRKRYHRLDQFDQLTQTFGFIWFVIGSVWVFGCYDCKSDYDADDDTGCDQTAYRFSLVMIVVLYILLAVPFLAILLYLIGMTLCRDAATAAGD